MEAIRFSRVQSTAGVCYRLSFNEQDDLLVPEEKILRSTILANVLAATDDEEDHAGVFQAPSGLLRNYFVFSRRIEQEEPLINDSDNSLVLALKGADFVNDQDAVETLSEAVAKCTALAFFPTACTFPIAVTLNDGSTVGVSKETALACLMTHNSYMFRVLPSHIVQNVMRYLQHHNIKEIFDALPEEFHPQVVQAFFPEVPQSKSLAVDCPLYVGNLIHFHELDESEGVHKNVLNAVAKIPDMEHLSVEGSRLEWDTIHPFLSSGLKNLTRLTFLRLEGPCIIKDSLPALQSLRNLQLDSCSAPGFSEPGIMKAIASLKHLETLQIYGWIENPRQTGSLLATTMRHLTGLSALDLSIRSGEMDRWYQYNNTPEFHEGIADGCMGLDSKATEIYLTKWGFSASDLAGYVFANRVECLSLQSLCISQLTFQTTGQAHGFARMLACCSGLQHLQMDRIELNNSIPITREPVAASLAPGFLCLESLKSLDLSFKPYQRPEDPVAVVAAYFGNDICDRGMFALSHALESLTSLERLRFSARCSARASDWLTSALLQLTQLTMLDLQRVSMRCRPTVSEAIDDEYEASEDFEPPDPFDEEALGMLLMGDGVPDGSAESSGELPGENSGAAAAAAMLHAALLDQLAIDAAEGGASNQPAIEAAAHVAQNEAALQNPCSLSSACPACIDPRAAHDAAFMSIASESAPEHSLHAKETNMCAGESLGASGTLPAAGPSSSCADTSVAMDHTVGSEAMLLPEQPAVASCSHAAWDHPAAAAGVQLQSMNHHENGAYDSIAVLASGVWPAGGLRTTSQESFAAALAALATSSHEVGGESSLAPDTPSNAPEGATHSQFTDTSSETSVSNSSYGAASEAGESVVDSLDSVELGMGPPLPPALSDSADESDAPLYAALETTISALKSFSGLKAFKLREVDIGSNPALCIELGQAIAQHSQLESLSLVGNSFCDDSLAFLLENMRGLTRMTELRIIEQVTFESSAALGILLPTLSSLRCLSLTYFQPMIFLNPEGTALFQALAFLPHLEVLSMTHCSVNSVAAEGLSESLRVMTALREINLSHNPLGNKGMSLIARALSKIPTLELMKLHDVGATLRGIKTMAWFFKRHKQIKECWAAQVAFEEDLHAFRVKQKQMQEHYPWMLLFRRDYEDDEE